MSQKTGISWTDATWNPVAGCSLVSPGCTNCYAMREAHRLATKLGQAKYAGLTEVVNGRPVWTGDVRLWPAAIDQPLRWREPRRIFVNSMSDLFHEGLTFEHILAVFGVMAAAPLHTFQVLTKRPERMLEFSRWLSERGGVPCLRADEMRPKLRGLFDAGSRFTTYRGQQIRSGADAWAMVMNAAACEGSGPLGNVWLGVSVEDQERADERIPLLLQTPAAVRFVSYEPALAAVDLGLGRWIRLPQEVRGDWPIGHETAVGPGTYRSESNRHGALSVPASNGQPLGVKPAEFERLPSLDWVIAGGESGPHARPCDLAWLRSAQEQCYAAGVPFFMKQMGSHLVVPAGRLRHYEWPGARFTATDPMHEATEPWRVHLRHRAGADSAEWPELLRAQQFPKVAA